MSDFHILKERIFLAAPKRPRLGKGKATASSPASCALCSPLLAPCSAAKEVPQRRGRKTKKTFVQSSTQLPDKGLPLIFCEVCKSHAHPKCFELALLEKNKDSELETSVISFCPMCTKNSKLLISVPSRDIEVTLVAGLESQRIKDVADILCGKSTMPADQQVHVCRAYSFIFMHLSLPFPR